ncbi:MAG: HAMP domain-containing histidine kinase [Cytophagaceae bacterium]|nr:HAMP domain-containing histidine kinase [Cytophagaceae bacterium]
MFRKLKDALREKILSVNPENYVGVQFWREKIYYSLSLTLVILGLIAYIPSVVVSVRNNLWDVVVIDTLVYIFILLLFFLKKSSYSFRVYGLLLVVFLLGVSLLVFLGPVGAGWVWLFAFPVFASILKGFRSAVFCIVINSLVLSLLGYLIYSNNLNGFLITKYNLESWTIVSVNFICLNGLVSIPIAVLLKALEVTLEEEKKIKALLKEEQRILNIRNNDLNKTNKDLDNFVYTASHDLRSPISNVEGLLNVLSHEIEGLNNKEVNELVRLMKVSIDKFKNTIQSLTEVSKVQRSEPDEYYEEINVREVFEDVRFNLSNLIHQYQPLITVDFREDKIRLSKKDFASILHNLLSNAIKYNDPKRPCEVYISTEETDGFFILSVSDNGLGMRPDFKEKIFKMFKRLHDHVEGTGIGLYIIKRIVENHGGSIEVESELGKGSVFKIFLKS